MTSTLLPILTTKPLVYAENNSQGISNPGVPGSVVPVAGRWEQEDHCKFGPVGYRVRQNKQIK